MVESQINENKTHVCMCLTCLNLRAVINTMKQTVFEHVLIPHQWKHNTAHGVQHVRVPNYVKQNEALGVSHFWISTQRTRNKRYGLFKLLNPETMKRGEAKIMHVGIHLNCQNLFGVHAQVPLQRTRKRLDMLHKWNRHEDMDKTKDYDNNVNMKNENMTTTW